MLMAALIASMPTTLLAQALTLTNLRTPIAKAAGTSQAKTIAELWKQINALPGPALTPAPTPLPTAAPELTAACGKNPARDDGFNAAFYLATYADVRGAGVDALDHWIRYGRYEGRLPYEGAASVKVPRPASAADGPPTVIMPEIWAPAGTKVVVVRGQLLGADGKPSQRSWSLRQGTSRGGSAPLFEAFPSNDGIFDFQMLTGGDGTFVATVSAGQDTPGWSASTKVHVGETPPAGYVYPETARTAKALPTFPDLTVNDFETNFLGDLTKVGALGGFSINNMHGWFVDPAVTRTVSGKIPDVYPIVDGVRVFRFRDQRGDPIVGADGKLYPFASPAVVINKLAPRSYNELIITLPLRFGGVNASVWGVDGWPPELDLYEGTANSDFLGRIPMRWHIDPDNKQQGMAPYAVTEGKHLIQWMRDGTWFRMWWDGRLVAETPDYAAGHAIGLTISLEGPGGDAAPGYDPVVNNYADDAVAMKLHRFRTRAIR